MALPATWAFPMGMGQLGMHEERQCGQGQSRAESKQTKGSEIIIITIIITTITQKFNLKKGPRPM